MGTTYTPSLPSYYILDYMYERASRYGSGDSGAHWHRKEHLVSGRGSGPGSLGIRKSLSGLEGR